MTSSSIPTRTVTIEDFQREIRRLIDEVASGETLITVEEDGKALVRLEPASTSEQREIDAMMQDSEFRSLAAISEALRDIPLDELEAEISAALHAGRERRRRDREESQGQ